MKSSSDSPYINRFVSAGTIVPGFANPQTLKIDEGLEIFDYAITMAEQELGLR